MDTIIRSLFLTFLLSSFTAAQPVSLSVDQWRADLKTMADELVQTHENAFHTVSKEEFESAVEKLDREIPTLQDHEIIVGMMRITAMIGDGHTGFRWGAIASSGIVPLEFYEFEDGIFVRAAAPEQAELAGAKLIKVGSLSVEEAKKRLAPLVWRDNDMGLRSAVPWYLSIPRILHAVRLSTSKELATYTFEKDGKELVREIKPSGKLNDLFNIPATWVKPTAKNVSVPLWRRDPANNFWFEDVASTKTFYIQYNSVQDKQDETVAAFFERAFKAAERSTAERLVIDMRLNGGGNNYLNRPMIIEAIRSKFNVYGKLFVIIGRETFSAAMNGVNDLEKFTNAVFVGEPTGASPNHFGDARRITLPNSKFQLQASTLWWQDKDPRDTRKWKAPDIAADLTFSDYAQGRDPALEAVLNFRPTESIDQIIAETRQKMDVSGFIERYRKFKQNPKHKYIETTIIVNRVGHFLLGQKKLDEAQMVFKINAEDNPGSAIVYQSLGDLYFMKGEPKLALENYRKAVSIDPSFLISAEAVKRLEKQLSGSTF